MKLSIIILVALAGVTAPRSYAQERQIKTVRATTYRDASKPVSPHGSSITHHVYQLPSDAVLEQVIKQHRPIFIQPQGDKRPERGLLQLMRNLTN